MIGIRTPGPYNFWVKFRGTGTPFYLGTGVTGTETEEEQFFLPVMNDLGGRSEPFQLVQDGQEEDIPLILNRYDNNVIQALRALSAGYGPFGAPGPIGIPPPLGGAVGGAPPLGSETGLARGTLVLGVSDFALIIGYSYAGTPSSGSFVGGVSDLPFGRVYLYCTAPKKKDSNIGSRTLEYALHIKAYSGFLSGATIGPTPAQRGFQSYVEGSLAQITAAIGGGALLLA